MAPRHGKKHRRRRRTLHVQKPQGVIHPRVQKVGPEHFGIVSVDAGKKRSKWLLADFYGNVHLPPTHVANTRSELAAGVATLRQAIDAHALHDVLVAVERTGRYHLPPQRALANAGWETRIVHPLVTKHFRQAAFASVKTDDIDLGAIHCASINGFAFREAPREGRWTQLQLLVRHRRDWVEKASALCCQIRDHLHAALPGYDQCFRDLWSSPAALELALHFGAAGSLRTTSSAQMGRHLRDAGIRFQQRTVDKARRWAVDATEGDPAAPSLCRIAAALNEDRARKAQDIRALERDIAAELVQTAYVVLLSVPGINVVSAAEFAGEAGPIEHYPCATHITGRAGLYPSRYQSEQVDHADGPLVKRANRRLRFALLQIADNLVLCNHYFGRQALAWQARGIDPRAVRVRVAQRFSRIAFQMVAGQQVFRHPATQEHHQVLNKLVTFHQEHQTPSAQLLHDLQAARDRLPRSAHADEAAPLRALLASLPKRRGPQPLGEILPRVLASLQGASIQSSTSGTGDPT